MGIDIQYGPDERSAKLIQLGDSNKIQINITGTEQTEIFDLQYVEGATFSEKSFQLRAIYKYILGFVTVTLVPIIILFGLNYIALGSMSLLLLIPVVGSVGIIAYYAYIARDRVTVKLRFNSGFTLRFTCEKGNLKQVKDFVKRS